MKPPSAPKPEGLSKPEMTISPPVPAHGQSVRRSRQSQLSPLQVSPHPHPLSRSQQDLNPRTPPQEASERPIQKLHEGSKQRQQLLLSAGSKKEHKGPEPLHRAIAECTSGDAGRASEANKVLLEYMCKPATVDLSYTLLLDHALAEKTRSPAVVPRTIALLKRYLFPYVPSVPTLQAVDAFCVRLLAELDLAAASRSKHSGHFPLSSPNSRAAFSPLGSFCKNSGAVAKSLAFLRAFVARQTGPLSSQRLSTGGDSPDKLRNDGISKVAQARQQPAPAESEQTKRGPHEEKEFLDEDIFSARWTLRSGGKGGKKQAAWAPSPVLTGSGGLSRPAPHPVRTLDDTGAAALLLRSSLQHGDTRTQVRPGSARQLASDYSAAGPVSPLDAERRGQGSALLPAVDAALLSNQIRTVAAAKRRPEAGPRSSIELKGTPAKRKTRPLFNYRPYSEQQPLKLSDSEIVEVMAAVCSEVSVGRSPPSPDPGGAQAADVAASVLIKMLLDMYLAGPSLAGPLLLRLLLDMLASGAAAVRCRAFDLLLNLGVHAHLLEPAAMQPEEGACALEAKAPPASGRSALAQFEEWVLPLVRELLLCLVQRGEVEEAVWAAGLSCLLYFVADEGRLCRRKVDGLDVRIVAQMLAVSRRHCWAESIHTALVRLAVNLLYEAPGTKKGLLGKRSEAGLNGVTANGHLSRGRVASLDLQQLERLGGLAVLCEEYAWCRSKEARKNVFAVLFDLAVLQYSQQCALVGQAPPSEEAVCAVAVALALAEAPEALALGFKLGLHATGEAVRQSILSAMQRDVTSGRLNIELLQEVTSTLDDLAATFARPPASFSSHVAATLAADAPLMSSPHSRSSPSRTSGGAAVSSEANTTGPGHPWRRPSVRVGVNADGEVLTPAWAVLRALLHSRRASDRTSGRLWLTQVLGGGGQEVADRRGQKAVPGEQLKEQLLAVLEQLHSHHPASPHLVGGPVSPRPESSPFSTARQDISQGVQILCDLLSSPEGAVRALFFEVVDRLLLLYERESSAGPQQTAEAVMGLLSAACQLVVETNSGDTPNVLQMCDLLFRHLFVRLPHAASHHLPPDAPLPALFLSGRVVAPPGLLSRLPVSLLQWPLLRLPATPPEGILLTAAVGSRGGSGPGSSLSDVRAAMLLLLMSRCGESGPAFDCVGGAFFRAVLDDPDPRMAVYVSTFLLRRMASEQPDEYRAALQGLVFQAQQSNNEKLLENPYLQIRGLLRKQAQLAAEECTSEEEKKRSVSDD